MNFSENFAREWRKTSQMASIIGECQGVKKATKNHVQSCLELEMSDVLRARLEALVNVLEQRIRETEEQWDRIYEIQPESESTEKES